MPWDARSCRVFLEIPDKSWCCYLAFDSFPCMEAESSWFFLCSALVHPVLGAGLTPLPHSNRIAQLEGPGEAPLQVHDNSPWTHSCWDAKGALGQAGAGSALPHPGHPTPAGGRSSCPTPTPIHGQQPGLIHLSPSLSTQPWLWAAQGRMIMPTL